MIAAFAATSICIPVHCHRAPDPVPIEEEPAEPFENTDPHQAPIRTPLNDEPVPDPNPSSAAGRHCASRWPH